MADTQNITDFCAYYISSVNASLSTLSTPYFVDQNMNTEVRNTCPTVFLYISIVICIIGLMTNLASIVTMACCSRVPDNKKPYLIVISVSDFLFLLNILPYLILQTDRNLMDSSSYVTYCVYLGIRYALSFIFIFISSWTLVAMVFGKILSRHVEMDSIRIKSLMEVDDSDNNKAKKGKFCSWHNSSTVTITTLIVSAIILHGVKLFEYETSYSPDEPQLMEKRSMMTGLMYELYIVTVNVVITSLSPYIFLLFMSSFYLIHVIKVKRKKMQGRQPNKDACLMFSLGLLHTVCYGRTLHQYMTMLFAKSVKKNTLCYESGNTFMMILNASAKIVLFKLFTYHFKYQNTGEKLNSDLVNSFKLLHVPRLSRKQSNITSGVKFSMTFRNPSYGHESEVN